MKYITKKIRDLARLLLGFFILKDLISFVKKDKEKRFKIKYKDVYPCLFDKTKQTGFDRHYIYHTAWAARKLVETKPVKHIDISSSLYFSSICSAFIPIEFYDFRPANIDLSNLESKQGDLLNLPFNDSAAESLSCMHVIEHIGLGRYGDNLDPNGDLKAAKELVRVLATNGNLFIVAPVGKVMIRFNAHRIYSKESIIEMFKPLKLKEFTLIPDKSGSPIFQAATEDVSKETFGCGCFWFVKK